VTSNVRIAADIESLSRCSSGVSGARRGSPRG
jgi:hypothetical protein